MATFQERVIGALTLQASTYEEVERDQSAMSQALIVVVAGSVSNGIGWIHYGGLSGIIRGALVSLIGWAIASALIWAIGTKVMPGPKTEADVPQVMRTLGFAAAPNLLGFLTIVPLLGWLLTFALIVWGLAATVVAVREALDYDDTMKAVVVCVIAWVVSLVVMSLLLASFGLRAMVF